MRRGAARPIGRCVALAATAALGLPATAGALVTPGSTAPAGARLQLVLPLAADDAGLTRFAEAVSTPGSSQYGAYRSVAWLARHFGASPATKRRVVMYMRRHGATDVSADATGQFVFARMDVARAQSVFGTSLSSEPERAGAPEPGRPERAGAPESGDPERGAHVARFIAPATPVRLPRALRGLVTGVVGLDTAPVATDTLPPSSGYQGPDPDATPSGCQAGVGEGGFVPNEYLGAYDYTPLQQQHDLLGQGERVALVEIDGYRQSDLIRFANCFALHLPQINPFDVSVGRALPPGGEATLDLEVLDAAAPDLKSIDVYETQPDAADVLKAISQPLQNPGFKPQIISVSLGLCENATLRGVGESGVRETETALKVATAAGISVLGASGDYGSADCADTNSSPPSPIPVLAVNFPSSSPWVTSVGGTNISLNPQNQIIAQTVWNDAATIPGNAGGGGLSKLFARPNWQNGTVTSDHRAQPDVAMLADVAPGYDVYCTAAQDCHGRGWQTFGGTSAATPLMAGGFALVDQLLRRHGEQALGLANPLLYRLGRNATTEAQVFFDVTSGSNDIGPFIRPSQQPLGCCSAAPGYDLASGWGGVNLAGFAQAALKAQPKLVHVTVSLPPGQRPYASKGISAIVGCTGTCDMDASARLSARGMRTFTAYSAVAHLVHAGTRKLRVLFDAQQLEALQMALAAHRRITAAVAGAIVDSAGNVERRTSPKRLRVSS